MFPVFSTPIVLRVLRGALRGPGGRLLEPYGQRCVRFARMFPDCRILWLRPAKRRSALEKRGERLSCRPEGMRA